jgi:hypothetical protein
MSTVPTLMGSAWKQALASEVPWVLEVRTAPEIPPHANDLARVEPHRWWMRCKRRPPRFADCLAASPIGTCIDEFNSDNFDREATFLPTRPALPPNAGRQHPGPQQLTVS